MTSTWTLCATLLAVLACPAQDRQRLAIHFDGGAAEPEMTLEGHSAFTTTPGETKLGHRGLSIRPSAGDRYYGVSVWRIPAHHPQTLILEVIHRGDRPEEWSLRLDDDPPHGVSWDRLVLKRKLSPGRNRIEVSLAKCEGVTTGRKLDFTVGIRRLQFSRRKKTIDDPALILDGVIFEGESSSESLVKRVRVLNLAEGKALRELENADGRQKNPLRETYEGLLAEFRGALAAMDEPTRVKVALGLLKKPAGEAARRAARGALAGLTDPAAVASFEKQLKRRRNAETYEELLWAFASSRVDAARARAFEWIGEKRRPTTERTALVAGLARGGDPEVAGIASQIPVASPWPLRAAMVRAMGEAPLETCVPALINVLREGGAVRVLQDASGALARRTGRDLGLSADRWATWWAAQKGTLSSNPAAPQASYHSFYGVPILPGRMVFVIDLSGSMREAIVGGKAQEHIKRARHLRDKNLTTRLDLAREELAHALGGLDERSHVGIVAYSDSASFVTKGLERTNKPTIARLQKRVRSLGVNGATNIYDGLLLAFHPQRKPHRSDIEDGPDTIYLVTDGDPSAGPITERNALRDLVLRWNLGRSIRVHTINVGPGNRVWMREVSQASGGTFLDLTTAGTPRRNR